MQLAIIKPTVNGIEERTGMICRLLHKNINHVISPAIATNPNILDHIIGNDHNTKCFINIICTESFPNSALNKNHNNPLTTTLIAIFATLGCVKNFVIFIRAGLICSSNASNPNGLSLLSRFCAAKARPLCQKKKYVLMSFCLKINAEWLSFVDMRSTQVRISNSKTSKASKVSKL